MRPSGLKSGFGAAFFCAAMASALTLLLPACAFAQPAALVAEDPGPSRHLTTADEQGVQAGPSQVALLVNRLQAKVLAAGLDRSPTWAALLHVERGEPQLRDGHFILSLREFSLRQELLDTVAALYGPEGDAGICRFPARYTWLQQQAGLPQRSLAHCSQLQELLERAPAQQISVVFASENLAQPSSMMGHLFLKTRGVNAQGNTVEHALTFFTDAASLNLPKLFFDSMVIGKKGYFTLEPYQDTIRAYVIGEQRSLWEYQLQLNDGERRLLMLHVHELRQADITYFFQRYNCATLVKHLLAVVKPQMLDKVDWWTTPKFVIQQAQAQGMVAAVNVKTPSRWLVRNLLVELPPGAARQVTQALDSHSTAALRLDDSSPAQARYLLLELARAVNTYHYDQGQIDAQTWASMDGPLRAQAQARFAAMGLQADQGRNPALSPPDKQWSLGWRREGRSDTLRLELLPVSHTLADDNAVSTNENELRLFDTAVLVDPAKGHVNLDRLTVYGVQSLLPWDPLTGGLSGGINLGFDRQLDANLQERLSFAAEGALGLTWRALSDVDAFAMLWGGWVHQGVGGVDVRPTAGVLVREVWGMKSIFRLEQTTWLQGQSGQTLAYHWTQIAPISPQDRLLLDASRTIRGDHSVYRVELDVKHLF